jgi:hypothetical protein
MRMTVKWMISLVGCRARMLYPPLMTADA